jgi:energy-coupling factor transporter ATP-binding protein EcfA2
MSERPLPAWLREVDNALVIAPHVVIAGNVLDYHLVDGRLLQTVPDTLWRVLEPAGYEHLIVFDPGEGVSVIPRTEESRAAVAALLDVSVGEEGARLDADLERCLRLVQDSPNREPPRQRISLAIEQASRLQGDPHSPSPEAFRFFQLAERLATTTRPVFRDGASLYNVCFWIAQSERDLPDWFASSNPRVRVVALPVPMPDDRRAVIAQLADADGAGLTAEERSEFVDDAVDGTAGLPLRAIEEIGQLARRHGSGLPGFSDAARAYRVGISDSPWQQEDTRRRVAGAEEALAARVLGQDAAIRLTLDILMRSVSGLTGAQSGGSTQKPRGVLFFAGPTGVGKTELAKALTELVFGSDDRYVRFDMSEFTAEHAEARLIGSPPGYVGHGAGGELTNAMRRQPFSLVLFDEIEKAHPRILDKFLQILDDGRLTDGAGGTVYFSEAILVFTSNAGMDETTPDGQALTYETPPEVMQTAVRSGVERYFRERLGRPELLNRLGGNIVVFGFITPDVADGIFDLTLARVADRLESAHGAKLVISADARESLRAYSTGDLSMGGRGIGARLEHALVNPLARNVFAQPPSRGAVVSIEWARETTTGWELGVA